MRAAVLRCGEPGRVGHDDYEPMPRFSSGRDRKVRVTGVMLPPGVRAAAVGRRALPGLGDAFTIDVRMPGWAMVVLANAGNERLFDGNEIPGPMDVPMLGYGELDVPGTVAELEPWRDAALQIWKREEGWLRTPRAVIGAPKSAFHFARSMGTDWKGALGELRTSHPGPEGGGQPDDASHPPIEGVSYDTWVEVRGGLRKDTVHPIHVELYATHRGVPPGRWEAVDAAWRQRAAADPRLKAWADWDARP